MLSKKTVALVLVLALALVSPAALLGQQEGSNVGDLALDFTLDDLNGNTHTLSDYRGGKVMLYFWATW